MFFEGFQKFLSLPYSHDSYRDWFVLHQGKMNKRRKNAYLKVLPRFGAQWFFLSTFRRTTIRAGQASFLVDQIGRFTVAAFLTFGGDTISHILF